MRFRVFVQPPTYVILSPPNPREAFSARDLAWLKNLCICDELHRFFGHAVAGATDMRGNGGPQNDKDVGSGSQMHFGAQLGRYSNLCLGAELRMMYYLWNSRAYSGLPV